MGGHAPFRQRLAAITALGVAVRGALLFRSLPILDRLYVPDDTFYSLAIARSLARGDGPSASVDIWTNGFQPLFVFLLTPLFALFDLTDDDGLRAALVLSALFGATNVALVGMVARRIASARPDEAGLLAALFWALSPVAVAGAFTGLETSLALTAALATVLLWGPLFAGRRRAWIAAGLACGLALLARVDLAFLVAFLGFAGLARGRWRAVLSAALVALVVVAPWWLWSTLHFGSPVPESGPAVRLIAADHQAVHLGPTMQMGWAAGTVLAGPFAVLDEVRYRLAFSPFGAVVFVAILLAALAAAWTLARRMRDEGAALFAHGAALLAFYAFVVPAVWFFSRYFHPIAAIAAIGLAALLAAAPRRHLPRAAAGALVALAVVQLVPDFVDRPSTSRDHGAEGVKGYRDVALGLLPQLPAGARLGALQSGALSYYADRTVGVVNLDGVVNADARRAIEAGALADHARAQGLTHFADWPFNVDVFERFSREAEARPVLRPVAEVEHGDHRFQLQRFEWAPSNPERPSPTLGAEPPLERR